jgi:hypothetical protein
LYKDLTINEGKMEKGKLNGTYTIRYKNGMIETYNYRLGERI